MLSLDVDVVFLIPFVLMVSLVCKTSLVLPGFPEAFWYIQNFVLTKICLSPVVTYFVATVLVRLLPLHSYSIVKCNHLTSGELPDSKEAFSSISECFTVSDGNIKLVQYLMLEGATTTFLPSRGSARSG